MPDLEFEFSPFNSHKRENVNNVFLSLFKCHQEERQCPIQLKPHRVH